MLPLFDMLANAQNGKGIDSWAAIQPDAAADRAGAGGTVAGLFARPEAQHVDPYGIAAS